MKLLRAVAVGLAVLAFIGACIAVDMRINQAVYGDPLCAFTKCVRVVP
jgi:hypothetical protein